MSELIQRRFINLSVDLTNPNQRSQFMKDLSLSLDDLVGALNSLRQSGPTANRPVLSADQIGQPYFDTTLGTPIWWNGTVWVNATGGTV